MEVELDIQDDIKIKDMTILKMEVELDIKDIWLVDS